MIHYLPAEVLENKSEALYNMMLLAEMDLLNGDTQITFRFVYDYELKQMMDSR